MNSAPPPPASASRTRGDGWDHLLGAPDPVEWFPPGTQLLRPAMVLLVAASVDGLVLLVLAGLQGPLRIAQTLGEDWGALLAGPAVGALASVTTTPYRVGVTPRGLLLGFFYGPLFVPWGLTFAEPDPPRRYCTVSFVDPRTMRLSSFRLRTSQARLLLDHPFGRAWPARAEAVRRWGAGDGG